MSHVQTRPNINALEGVPLSNSINVSNIATSVNNVVNSGFSFLHNELINNINLKTTTLNTQVSTISSPVSLKSDFKQMYTENLREISSTDTLVKQKASFINTISNSNYNLTSTNVIEQQIKEVINASTQEAFAKNVETVMNEIQEQHTEVFVKEIGNIVREVSSKVNFKQTQIKTINNTLTIVALNDKGQALLSEIRVEPKTKKLDIVTETVGISDDTCTKILKQFDDELKKAGVRFNSTDSKWTGGVPWLPNSQKLDKELKARNQVKSKNEQNDLNRKAQQLSQNFNKMRGV